MKITVENLGKRFNREWIFKKLTYEFNPGVYAITGPNGSGKSTFLQVLWGQMPPSEGTISYHSNDGKIDIENIYKHLSIATPYMDLIEEFTLEEMISFHFRFKSAKNSLSMNALLDKMELAHARTKLISNFSSGMRQRLKLGLAFYSDSDILFLDEPTTNLDAKSTHWYLNHLGQIDATKLVFIASNEERDYPADAENLNIITYK